jgi:putative tryptophan/tyrosine transport system substrate-binding protein
MIRHVKRREFISGIGSATAWPMVAWAQQPRRVSALMGWDQTDPRVQARFAAFRKGLRGLDGPRGLPPMGRRRHQPRGLFSQGAGRPPAKCNSSRDHACYCCKKSETKDILIVFMHVADPVGSGFVKSLSHPGNNMTGFVNLEATIVEKNG